MAREDRPSIELTPRFADAVAYASRLHADQSRKDSTIPYVSHLLGTAAHLLEQPAVTEDMAIAALLHDLLEDCAAATSPEEVEERFGPDVRRMVEDCSDTQESPKPPWRHRKDAYIAHLRTLPHTDSLQVSLADKLHNARSMVADLRRVGPVLWDRFNAPPVGQRWYYTTLLEVFADRLPGNPQVGDLEDAVERATGHLPSEVVFDAGRDRPTWVGTGSLTGAATDLRAALAEAGLAEGDLREETAGAWSAVGGGGAVRWWIEAADAGSGTRPLALFVAPRTG